MLSEDLYPELGLLRVGNTFLRLASGKEGLRGLVASLVVAVIRAADHAVGVQFDLAAFLVGGGGVVGVEDLDPVDPEGELGSNPIASMRFAEDFEGTFVGIERAAFAEEEPAAAAVDDVDGEFQELRRFHRPRHLMGAGDGALQGAELEEVSGFRGVGGAGDPDANGVFSSGPAAWDVEGLVRIGEDVGVGEKGTGLGSRVIEIGPLLGGGQHPVAPPLLVGMDLVDVAELLGRGRSGDPFPFEVSVGLGAFLLGLDGGDDGEVFWFGGGGIDGGRPSDIAIVAVDTFRVGFRDPGRGVVLGFQMDLQGLRRLPETDEVFIDRLTPEREVAFELVRRHEEG